MMVPDAVTYCASKFYVSSFTEGLALELGKESKNIEKIRKNVTKSCQRR